MSIEEYINKMKSIENALLTFLESEDNEEEYRNFTDIVNKYQICNDKHELILFLHLISTVSEHHHRYPKFISNIEKILQNYSQDIKKHLTNSKIFSIFKNNKRILLFLYESQIVSFTKDIIKKFFKEKYIRKSYPQYFLPEIRQSMNEDWFKQYQKDYKTNEFIKKLPKEIPEDFNEKRKEGENDSHICSLIRNDSVIEFIKYVTENNYSLDSTITSSIFETNSFLFYRIPSLIAYSAFYGSIQIMKYLQMNQVKLSTQHRIYAVHSKNPEVIRYLEDNLKDDIEANMVDYYNRLFTYESIKCHYNDITDYYLNNYFEEDYKKLDDMINHCLEYYNFSFMQTKLLNENYIYYLVKYDYYSLISLLLLNDSNFDVNKIPTIIF